MLLLILFISLDTFSLTEKRLLQVSVVPFVHRDVYFTIVITQLLMRLSRARALFKNFEGTSLWPLRIGGAN